MAGVRAAIRYAKALLSLASDQNTVDAVNNDMKLIADSIADSNELNEMLQSPVINSTIKKSALLEVFKNISTSSINLIETLIINKRLNLLGDVANKYNELYDQLKGIQVAEVTTAVPLTDEIKNKVLDTYFINDRSVRESGHDTSYRIDGNCANLNLVELNALLYKYETDFAMLIKTVFNDFFIFFM